MSAQDCPVLTVVSARAWKHWCCAALILAAGLGILLVDYSHPDWAASNGPRLARLLAGSASPILAWGSSLCLFTTAQAACIIWWARSRSLRDFGGSYRIWAWAAATWLLFSFATATQANLAWSEVILRHIHWKTPGAMLWCWLLPASAWGWGLALRLEQELRDNRPCHWLFLLAGTWYLAVVALLCQREFWPQACSPEISSLLLATAQLLGQASLLLSHALHARFVLSCTAEPPLARRRQLAKAAEQAAPRRSWLRSLWPTWLFSRGSAADPDEEEDEAKPKRSRKRATATKKKAPARKASRPEPAVPAESDGAADESWDSEEAEDEEAGYEGASAEADSQSSGKNYRFDDAESDAGGPYAQMSDDQMKGLSKRDRRRLQQQMREQERRGGR